MIIEPHIKPLVAKDINAEFRNLKGELSEDAARISLGKFLANNMGVLAWTLTGQIIEPYQRIVIKGWMQKNFSLTIAARSFGKSLCSSHFAYLYCLLHPGHTILCVAANFRSSRQTVERIDTWSKRKTKGKNQGGELLRQTFARDMVKRQDMNMIEFKNGSKIIAVPLGDPDNLRGFRCNVLLIDEGLLISQNTINLVLKPFLAGGADATKKQLIQRRESRKIEMGQMKDDERTIFKPDSKMIVLSSASYKWEELYETYKSYRSIIEAPDAEGKPKGEETEKGAATYLVHQLSYKIVNPALMDKGILDEIKNKLIPESVIKREYEAQFTDESDGYFSAREMGKCTIPMGQRPHVEIVGEAKAEYVLGIDPNMSSGEASDHFAIVVIKIIAHKDGRKMGLVVHQYACSGVGLEHHINYLYYLLTKFNVVYIAVDSSSGDNATIINICNESQLFKDKKIQLNPIDAEFGKEGFDEIVKQVKKSYNPDSAARRIVQQQSFHGSFQKAANEHLRACFDRHLLLFASHAQSVPDAMPALAAQDIMGIHNSHPEFRDEDAGLGNMYEFINNQDRLIDLVKKECALIEVSQTPQGHQSFDLPHHMTRNRKNVNRVRRDSYSALLVGVWGLKIHLAAQELPVEAPEELPAPMMFGR